MPSYRLVLAGLLLALGAEGQEPATGPPGYDKAIFQKPIPADQLAFLNQFAGRPASNLVGDKQFG